VPFRKVGHVIVRRNLIRGRGNNFQAVPTAEVFVEFRAHDPKLCSPSIKQPNLDVDC